MSVDPPARVVVDAGPLIAYFNRRDRYHADARRGFDQLVSGNAALVTPLPVVFEVYKWLVYHVSVPSAGFALRTLRESTDVLAFDADEMEQLEVLVESMPRWAGSLEDALVAMVGLRTDTPVWTLNYRDLAAFPNLRFWTPA